MLATYQDAVSNLQAVYSQPLKQASNSQFLKDI